VWCPRNLKLWDAAAGEEVRTFVGQPDQETQGPGAREGTQTQPRGGPGAPRLASESNSAMIVASAALRFGQ
jgi:hypothetical protein